MLVREGTKAEIQDRTVTFVLSDETRDRHGTIIKSDAWDLENYKKNPIVAYQHETQNFLSDPDYIIGRGDVWQEEGKLMGSVTFEDGENNPLAEKIFNKVRNGILNAVSVGFIPKAGNQGSEKRGEDPETYYFTRAELAEFSVVNIPSNPNAIKRSYDEYFDNITETKEDKQGLKALTLARFIKLKLS